MPFGLVEGIGGQRQVVGNTVGIAQLGPGVSSGVLHTTSPVTVGDQVFGSKLRQLCVLHRRRGVLVTEGSTARQKLLDQPQGPEIRLATEGEAPAVRGLLGEDLRNLGSRLLSLSFEHGAPAS